MKSAIAPASTSKIRHVFIQDSTVTDGSGKTALVFSDITAYYVRAGGTLTALTMETIATLGTWASTGDNYLGFKLLHDTNAPGVYELHLPNNILAAGADAVVIQLRATGAAPCLLEIQLANVPADKRAVLGTALTEGAAGRLAAAEVAYGNVATPVFTAASVNQTGDVKTQVPQAIAQSQIGGTGPYYVLALTSGGALIHVAGAAVAKSPATLDWSADVSNPPTIGDATAANQGSLASALVAIAGYVDCLPAEWVVPAGAGAAMALTSGERTTLAGAILDLASAIDGKTLRQALRYIAAAVAGKISGAGTGTETAYGMDGTTARIAATVDSSGNRTAMSYDPT